MKFTSATTETFEDPHNNIVIFFHQTNMELSKEEDFTYVIINWSF